MWILACSGPGARSLILYHIAISAGMGLTVGLLAVSSLILCNASTHRKRHPAACLSLFILHPAWTVSALTGDCGTAKAFCSAVATLAALAVIAFQVFYALRLRKRRSKPPGSALE